MKRRTPLIDWTPKLYDRLSRYYDLAMRFLFPIGSKGHARVASDLEAGSILDIACGTGTLLALARKAGLDCRGIDTSKGMLRQATKKVPSSLYVRADFYHLPFPDESFDYVVETNALSGVSIDIEKVVEEMIRVCKIGGEVRIGDYATAAKETTLTRLIEKILFLIGDYPYDYVSIFKSRGHDPTHEILGLGGMYQFIRVIR
ncbi:MAG: methyltransferase domain-containing protein [Anaerolineales bacterium]|nr:methyltransferase domain-containing protein [Anaerolineales bacterium]